jgi:hypothetical protein
VRIDIERVRAGGDRGAALAVAATGLDVRAWHWAPFTPPGLSPKVSAGVAVKGKYHGHGS